MTATLARPILRDPAFGRLWFIQASTQIGGNMSLYALTILVFATTRSNAAVSALVMSYLLPTILLSAVGGVLVDRLDVRWAMVIPNTIRTVLTFGLALAGANVAVLLLLNLGVSLTTVVLTPAEASMIPRIVPKPQLETAMGIFNLTLQASFAVGFAFLGPLLVSLAGPSFVLVVVTVFYAAATATTLFLPAAPPVARDPDGGPRTFREPVDQLRDGLAAITGNREVSRPLIHLAAAASLVGVIAVVGPNLALSLGLDPKNLIVVVMPLGLGVVAGVFGLNRLGGDVPRRRAGEGGLLTFGVLALAIAAVSQIADAAGLPVVPLVAVLAFVAGSAYAITAVSAQTALFENMPAGVRGRVFGVLASIIGAASLVPILIAGPLADATSAPTVIAIAATGVLIVAGWSATLFGPRGSAG
ncbi:MAG TPA: MFS transporter [Candidatus Limnocylindrales bacterium]|nr:MFS transporter [Candidatus Limnocylindrales bacterium]